MATILLIDTSADVFSVAISRLDGPSSALGTSPVILAEVTGTEPRTQSAMLMPAVDECLRKAGLSPKDLDAVCVSKGPGSYTGLRVGVSTAKGLCMGLGIPLIAIGTLELLFAQALPEAGDCKYIIPMIDARRMEVYSAVFSIDGTMVREIRPEIVEPGIYDEYLSAGPVLFTGDGALKCRDILVPEGTDPSVRYAPSELSFPDVPSGPLPLTRPRAAMPSEGSVPSGTRILPLNPSAKAMAGEAAKAFDEKRFEDLAYFEPFYLKDFVAKLPSRKLF